MPKLTIFLPDGDLACEITGNAVSVGRRNDNQIQIKEPTVSGHHARIFLEGGKYQIEDLDSTNGTFVNGARITKAELKDSDKLRIGLVNAIYQAPAPMAVPAPRVLPKPPRPLGVKVAA
jgi:pSer/pThr/pTyr-binding forkhead associated (FHA) protein